MGGRRRRVPGRLGPIETLGAWLRIWTPPREATVPPVPWRAIVAGAAVAVVAIGAAAALVIPRVAENRREADERARRAAAERHAAFLASVDREQRPRRGSGPADLGADAPPRRRRRLRAELLATARTALAADARTRTDRTVRGVQCEPFPRSAERTVPAADLALRAAAYGCVVATANLPGRQGVIGIPFRLVLRFDRGRFAFCRIVPLGDRDRLSHPLPAACRV